MGSGRRLIRNRPAPTGAEAAVRTGPYDFSISESADDSAWDAFLASVPGGHYAQTSVWAQSKAPFGWRALRVIARAADQRIVAGAQLLLRVWPLLGAIAYVSNGPLLAVEDASLATCLLDELNAAAQAARVHYLVVQPPEASAALAPQLRARGFRPSLSGIGYRPVTTRLDLTLDLADLAAHMRRTTRYHLRYASRKGVRVHEGDEADLPAFHRLLVATGQRHHFPTYSAEYYAQCWRLLAPRGMLKLFFAEYAGEAVSALLALPFGDTVTYWIGAWSGQHADVHPNVPLHWAAITWAKTHGYRRYDFAGVEISDEQMQALATGALAPEPANLPYTLSLGYGGPVVCLPMAYEYLPNPILRWTYTEVSRQRWMRALLRRTVARLRGLVLAGQRRSRAYRTWQL